MPRTKISEYSTTNSDNTDIESININEGCAPSGINNAIRELMVHLKEFQTGSSGDPLTVAGTFVASGGATIAASAGTSASPSIHFSGDTNTGIFSPAADTIAFAGGGVESVRINSDGEVLINTSATRTEFNSRLLIEGTTSTPTGSIAVINNNASAAAGYIALGKTRGAIGSNTTIVSGDSLGSLLFYGADGTGLIYSAGINVASEGTIATGQIPSRMSFSTASSAGTVTERMRIDSSGNVLVGGTSVTTAPTLNKGVYLQSQTNNDVIGYSLRVDDGANVRRGSLFLDDANGTFGLNATATSGVPDITFTLGGTERMRITSAGEVLVGGTTEISSGSGIITLQRSGTPVVNLFRNDTTVTSGESLGSISYYGNDTTSNTPTQLAYINAVASGTHAAGDNPTDILFGTTPDGSETVAEAMRLTQAKNLKIGGTASRATTEGTNQVVLFNGTAPVGTLTNGVSFYSAAGEARVMDAAGNSTLLSPHDQSTNEWIFHSKHTPSGKVLRIDVERLLKFVNDHFGLDAVHEFIE